MKALVWGLGESGQGAIELLKARGYQVLGAKDGDLEPEEALKGMDLLVLSPGISPRHKIIKLAKDLEIETIGELELAWRFFRGTALAITGTDGKSTTTRMLYLILKRVYGDKVFEGGNAGLAFSRIVLKDPEAIAVLEVSSFQGRSLKTFRPKVGAFLNFSPDHLDWHEDIWDYLYSKHRIFLNQTEEDFLLLNGIDNRIKRAFGAGKKFFIPQDGKLEGKRGIFFGETLFENLKLKCKHNAINALFAGAMAKLFGVETTVIKEVLESFTGLEHRLELVKEIKNVKIFNDSKSTTPNALKAALECFEDKSVILIAGGKNKGLSFKELKTLVKRKLIACFLIGESKEEIATELSFNNLELCDTLEEATKKAIKLALSCGKECQVLFSPGCASFDMFKSYRERGEKFKALAESYSHSMVEGGLEDIS
ncbi:MAG: UDP-N-acetylmuramoyl-L-alanine--D-glutamate ligase [Aquificaceae bacterium]